MSGGSFDYLGSWGGDVEEMAKRRLVIGYMADRLESMDDGKLAARLTRDVNRLLLGAERLGEQLSDVWHAIEWWQSCDYGEDQARAALARFNAEHGQPGDARLSEATGSQPVPLSLRSEPDRLRHLAAKLLEGDQNRSPVALALEVMADEIAGEPQ